MTTATLEPRALPCVGRALLSRAALHPVLLKGTPTMTELALVLVILVILTIAFSLAND